MIKTNKTLPFSLPVPFPPFLFPTTARSDAKKQKGSSKFDKVLWVCRGNRVWVCGLLSLKGQVFSLVTGWGSSDTVNTKAAGEAITPAAKNDIPKGGHG
jgi:hypothetical protein